MTKWMTLLGSIAMIGLFGTQAQAGGTVELGGRTAVTANFSVITNNPDRGLDTTSLLIAGTLTRNTADARFEYGLGLGVISLFSDIGDASFVSPTAQVRVNTDLLGAEENILAYAGFVAGLTFVDIDGLGDDVMGAFGPKFGAEYYFSSSVALQLEDMILFDTESGVTNSLTLGIKVLF